MAHAVFAHEGNAVDYTPSADIAAGDVVVQGDLVGVARAPIAANTLGSDPAGLVMKLLLRYPTFLTRQTPSFRS